MSQGIFSRSELLLGQDTMQSLASKKVILFGIGGVGSWCAESLVRSGITQLTIVDSDRVCASNINRQLMATTATIGQVKTDVLKARLLEINPEANITALQKIYSKDTFQEFELDQYDVIIDAIDSLSSKVHLIHTACQTGAIFVSSMGAALKMDPTKIQVASFWKVQGCPLARKIRKMMRKQGALQKDFLCVYSEEVLENRGADSNTETPGKAVADEVGPGDPALLNHDWGQFKAVINGTMVHITAIFGFTLAGLVIKALTD